MRVRVCRKDVGFVMNREGWVRGVGVSRDSRDFFGEVVVGAPTLQSKSKNLSLRKINDMKE